MAVTDYHGILRLRQLPRRVSPFPRETLPSYLRRLARANHLQILTTVPERAIAPPRGATRDETVAHLAALTGLAPVTFDRGLAWNAPDRGTRIGMACTRCAATRSVFDPIDIVAPRDECLCIPHRRWLAASPVVHELSLDPAPEIVAAARRHHRLVRRRGREIVADADAVAAYCVAQWFEAHHFPAAFASDRTALMIRLARHRPGGHARDAVLYPARVALTSILVSPNWLPLAATPDGMQRLNAHIAVTVTNGYVPTGAGDPFRSWLHSEMSAAIGVPSLLPVPRRGMALVS